MPKPRIVRFAESWVPDPKDPFGEDKRRLIRYLLDNGITVVNPRSIQSILGLSLFERSYTREAFQHRLLGPLRRDPRVFIGTSSAGLFLVTTPQDADATLGFYTWRVRAELRHARNLRRLARRTKLMEGYTAAIPPTQDRATIYLDESGSPNVSDHNPPVFVVAAVLIDSREDLAGLDSDSRMHLRRFVGHKNMSSGPRVFRSTSIRGCCGNSHCLTTNGPQRVLTSPA
jgi:hypothetical protein